MKHSPLLMAVKANAQNTPGKIAIIEGEMQVSYAQLLENVMKASHVLERLGISSNDRIVLSAKKDIRYIYMYLGAHAVGATNVLVDAEQNDKRLEYIEKMTEPKYCFGYESRQYPYMSFDQLDLENAECTEIVIDNVTEDDIAEILFTTGTTGDPKGVCLSYANIYVSACNINEFIKNDTDDVEVLGLPVCHSFGMGRIRCNLIKGSTIILLGNFANVRLFVNTIEKYKATGFGVVPAAWAYIRKISGTRLSKFADQIKFIEIGSAAMPLETKEEMLQMFPNTRICMHYGLTEASRSVFIEFHDTEHIKSIGKPVTDRVDVKIFNSEGVEQPVGVSGELCVKGNMVMRHYLEEKDTEKAFFNGYFRTGDNGYIDNEGYLYLMGREKELINVGGKKVSPMEVEDAICALGVGDCVCVPMKDPDGIMGELVKCYILKDSTTLTFEEIAELLAKKLEPYKRPSAYDYINAIPMTSSGKKQRVMMQGKDKIKIRPANGLYFRTFEELKENTDLGYDDSDNIMASLDENQRVAILDKPTGYDPEEVCQILAISNNKVVGTQMCYSSRAVIDGEEIICNHASTVFSHPDYRSKGVGGNLLIALTKLKPWRNTITGGNSQMSLPIFKALRYNSFEFPRFIFLLKSRCAVQYVLHSNGIITKALSALVDTVLKLQRKYAFSKISKYARTLTIEKCTECPKVVEDIVADDPHRFREQHDKAWFDWNMKYDFNPDHRKSKTLYVVKDKEEIVGFFVHKIQFYETASSRGFKDVLLGSVMEWGIKKGCPMSESDIQLLAIKAMPSNVDGVQVATDDKETAGKFKKVGAFPMDNANMCVRLRSIKDADVKEAMKDGKNWRLRLACNDTLVN